HYFPVDGEYAVRIRLQRNNREEIRGLGDPDRIDVRVDGAQVTTFDVGRRVDGLTGALRTRSADDDLLEYELSADSGLAVRLAARAGTHVVTVTFPQRERLTEGMRPEHYSVWTYSYKADKSAAISIESVQIDGPYHATAIGDTPSRRRVFICHPTDAAHERP